MDIELEKNRLLQTDQLRHMTERVGKEAWVTVYSYTKQGTDSLATFSALIPKAKVQFVLQNPSWDMHIGDGKPGFVSFYNNNKEVNRYYRFSDDNGIEPLIFKLSFNGLRPDYTEVSEEFRLFHNLYHDQQNKRYIFIDDNGDEHDAITYSESQVRIKLTLLKQYLKARKMALAVFIDSVRYSTQSPEDLSITEIRRDIQSEDHRLNLFVGTNSALSRDDERKSFSRLIGKSLILGSTKNSSKQEKKAFPEFIIGIDTNGEPITNTCDPDKLRNFFGSNPDAPSYLTPVFFRRDVLTKYYANPAKYSVTDGSITCGSLWGLNIDNNHDSHVVVFLGDLGRDLHPSEQLYWQSFNVVPDGKISDVNFRRSFVGQFADPSTLDLIFKWKFEAFQASWTRKYGWPLFKPLAADDAHYYKSLRIPLTVDRSEFDDQVLALAKIMVDSLNESKIQECLATKVDNEKGISKFERFAKTTFGNGFENHIAFLRNLYKLRHGAGHRKGEEYRKISAFYKLDERSLIDVFKDILKDAIALLDSLQPPAESTGGL